MADHERLLPAGAIRAMTAGRRLPERGCGNLLQESEPVLAINLIM